MSRPVTIYPEMLQKDVSGPRPATPEDILTCLETYWEKAGEEHDESQWPTEQRTARRLWAGLGLLAFGRLDHLEETFRILQTCPQAAASKVARYYLSALQKLLPLPEGLSPLDHPGEALQWWHTVSERLIWSEEAGRFVETLPEVVGRTLSSSREATD